MKNCFPKKNLILCSDIGLCGICSVYSDRSSENLGSRETIFQSVGEVGDLNNTKGY